MPKKIGPAKPILYYNHDGKHLSVKTHKPVKIHCARHEYVLVPEYAREMKKLGRAKGSKNRSAEEREFSRLGRIGY